MGSLSSAFSSAGFIADFTTQLGRESFSLVKSSYGKPLILPQTWQSGLSDFHVRQHIQGRTGAWMDALKGPNHRIFHGHHLIEDGLYVIGNPELKFGEFLHHLGVDFLSTKGIPFIPKKIIKELAKLNFLSESTLSSYVSLNLAKTLEGGLFLVCSGHSVIMALTDAIPHTLSNAGMHFAYGCFDLGCGLFSKNILCFPAAAGEFYTSAVTLYRAISDPIIPMLGVPGSVFYPALFQSMLVGGVIGGTISALSGRPLGETLKIASIGSLSSAAATFSKYAVGSFAAPVAGIATFFIAKAVLDNLMPENEEPFYKAGRVGNDNGFFKNGADRLSSPSALTLPSSLTSASRLTLPSKLTSPSCLTSPSRLTSPSGRYSTSEVFGTFRDVPTDTDEMLSKLKQNPIGFIENGTFYPNTEGIRNAL